MRFLAFLFVVSALAGCSSGGLAGRSFDGASSDQRNCQRYGFKPNTDAFAQCMLQLDQIGGERDAMTRERRNDALIELAQALL